MTYMAGGAAAATAAAIANATKAWGTVVFVEPDDFIKVLNRADKPVVVAACGGIFKKTHRYLTSFRGLAFFTKSESAIQLPSGADVIATRKIWIPQ